MQRLTIAVVATFLMGATAIDWKLYGNSMLGRELMRSFYSELELLPNGHLQVSTEDFTSERLTLIKTRDLVKERATGKLKAGYRPPIAHLGTLSDDELVNVIELQELANDELIAPRIQTVRELDCAGKKIRVLRKTQDGMEIDANKLNLSWERVLPETSRANLFQLVCH